LSDYPEIFNEKINPADTAGLMTGDRIIRIDNNIIKTFSDMQRIFFSSPGKTLSVMVERNSKEISLSITPLLNEETGAGRIGVSPWIEAVVDSVATGSSAYIGGLKEGDIIKSANGIIVTNLLDIEKVLSSKPEYLKLSIDSNTGNQNLSLVPIYMDDGNTDLGIVFKSLSIDSENMNILSAIKKGTAETIDTLLMTIKGIRLLFSGIDVKEAVSGPIRISYFVGKIATNSFKENIKTGLTTIFRFLSIISIALGFFNLLPIPIFDGGLILFTSIELIRGKALRPSIFYRFQSIGFLIIIILILFTTYNDISYLFLK
ncbi:MAG: site-2 protease family protein, partial [Spirochaetales bacterium]|nr:site-2 protease family protein [Spirochaetales bacterium]